MGDCRLAQAKRWRGVSADRQPTKLAVRVPTKKNRSALLRHGGYPLYNLMKCADQRAAVFQVIYVVCRRRFL